MGFALAEECLHRGANVVLISGPVALTCSERIKRINVESSEEMYDIAMNEFSMVDAAILCAAVADFKPKESYSTKIKRKQFNLSLELTPTKDIAAALGEKKKNQKIIAFALETNDEEINARTKLEKKKADFIVLNSTRIPNTTFQSDYNQISIISKNGKEDYEKKSKKDVASDIINKLVSIL